MTAWKIRRIGKIIFKRVLNKLGVMLRIGFIWPKMGTSDGFMWTL